MASTEMVTVRMSRGHLDTPWGFDVSDDLHISNVVGGSLADRAGLLNGDKLVELEGHEQLDVNLARQLLAKTEHRVELVVHRIGGTVHRIWKPSVTENTEYNRFQHSVHNVTTTTTRSETSGGVTSGAPPNTTPSVVTNPPPPPQPSVVVPPVSTQTPTTVPLKVSLEHQNQDGVAIPGFNVSAQPYGNHQEVKHLQYNSPMPLYSPQSAAEQYLQQTGGLFGTDPNLAKSKDNTPAYLRSETLRLIQESERSGGRPQGVRMTNAQSTQKDEIRTQIQQENSSIPKCYSCGRNILGVMCKAFDRTLHPDCFQCATCGASLKNQGHYFINEKFYCDVHGRQLKGRDLLSAPAPHPDISSMRTQNVTRTQERAFYQPEVMSRRPLSISPTPWKTSSPISPSARGVPAASTHYGQSLRNESYSTHQQSYVGGENGITSLTTPHTPLPSFIRSATLPLRRGSLVDWPPRSSSVRRYWQYDHRSEENTNEPISSVKYSTNMAGEKRRELGLDSSHNGIRLSAKPYTTTSTHHDTMNKTKSSETSYLNRTKDSYRPLAPSFRMNKTKTESNTNTISPSFRRYNSFIDIMGKWKEKNFFPSSTMENFEDSTVTVSRPLTDTEFRRSYSTSKHDAKNICSTQNRPPITSVTDKMDNFAKFDSIGKRLQRNDDKNSSEQPFRRVIHEYETKENKISYDVHEDEMMSNDAKILINGKENYPFRSAPKWRENKTKKVDERWVSEEREESKKIEESCVESGETQDGWITEEFESFDKHTKATTARRDNNDNDILVEPTGVQRLSGAQVIKDQSKMESSADKKVTSGVGLRGVMENNKENCNEDAEITKEEVLWNYDEKQIIVSPERKKKEDKIIEKTKEEIRLMDERDRRIAIESIERHQRQLTEQQDHLSKLLDKTINFLKNMDSNISVKKPDGNNKPSDDDKTSGIVASEVCSTVPCGPAERIITMLTELDAQSNKNTNTTNTYTKPANSQQFRTSEQRGESWRQMGTLQNQGGRVPYCEECKQQIRGAYVLANGRTWCPEHFTCANRSCNRKLLDIGFVEDKGQKYCEHCFESLIAPHCAKCSRPITADCLNALQKQWHPYCFVCVHCHKPFGNSAFYLEQGQPYCEADWNALFTTKCVACKFPIEAGDRWVEALGSAYHSNCFNCTHCNVNLEGESFYAKNGAPYCKLHA
ncbi:hypothetical protein AB6A40_000751 [Gnathostoma spinigerum]|uniref:PDZ and LIM domain protein Zasp n=1 Tax=Gnathostoma spinigerum TaxID=75299 RepID=A0ABD6EBI1_9BILA